MCTTWKRPNSGFSPYFFPKKQNDRHDFLGGGYNDPGHWKLRDFSPNHPKKQAFSHPKSIAFPTIEPNWKLRIFHPIKTKKTSIFPTKKHSISLHITPIGSLQIFTHQQKTPSPKQVAWLFRMTLASAFSVTFRQVFFGAFTRQPSHQAGKITELRGYQGASQNGNLGGWKT